jgi:hypothetical protein
MQTICVHDTGYSFRLLHNIRCPNTFGKISEMVRLAQKEGCHSEYGIVSLLLSDGFFDSLLFGISLLPLGLYLFPRIEGSFPLP